MSKNIIPPALTKEEQRELELLMNHLNRARNFLSYVMSSDENRYNYERFSDLSEKKTKRKQYITSFFSES